VTALRVIVSLLLVAMVGGLVYGFGWGGGWSEVGRLMGSPWFLTSLVDVYVGFALFACWIASREKPVAAAAWIVPLMVLGNVVACVYVLARVRRASE